MYGLCDVCRHSTGWKVSVRGCGATTNSGPCSSDYEYCGCKNALHNKGRCDKITYSHRTNSDGFSFYEPIRCIYDVINDFALQCSEHSTEEEYRIATKKHSDYLKAYSKKKEAEALDWKIKDAIQLLEKNSYKVELIKEKGCECCNLPSEYCMCSKGSEELPRWTVLCGACKRGYGNVFHHNPETDCCCHLVDANGGSD